MESPWAKDGRLRLARRRHGAQMEPKITFFRRCLRRRQLQSRVSKSEICRGHMSGPYLDILGLPGKGQGKAILSMG